MAYPITRVRKVTAEDGAHEHVDLVGYLSPHTPFEPVMVPIPRILDNIALGEAYMIERDGEQIPVTEGKCPVCGFEPYLKTEKDPAGGSLLNELPEA